MKYSKTYKLFSTFLAILMILLSFPCMAIEINNEEPQGEIFQEPDPVSENSEVYIIQEDTTKRGEFEKHYICSDGTYVVASYAEAIHYKDDHGEWVDVDNRPVQTTAGDYTTRNGDFGISVPSSTGDGHLMRMDKGEHSLSWTLSANKKAGSIKMDSDVSTMAQKPVQSQKMQISTTKRPEIIISNSEQPHENHKVLRDEATFDLPNVSSKVRYDDLFGTGEGISVVYTTYRNKIEEDIYIEKPTDITSFSMEVAAPELTARLNSDNSVDFLDNEGKVCYHVGIPYMMDADFVVLNDIETTVTRSGETWVITYTPDAVWFTSEERAYPILLDPSITTNEYRVNIQDTYVMDGESETVNHSTEQFLYLSYSGNDCKAIIRVNNFPAIDATMPIINASFTFMAAYCPFSGTTAMFQLDYSALYCDRALSAYTYDMATNAMDNSEISSNAYLTYNTTAATFGLRNHIYQIFEDGGDFILGYDPDYSVVYCGPFYSSDYTTVSMRPVMSVIYGYSLPSDKIADGKIISIQNCGSMDYMTTIPSAGANVYQLENEEWVPTNFQKFRLEKVSATGGYRLYPISSSSLVVGIKPIGGVVYGTQNVELYASGETNTQEWLFVPVSRYEFRIIPRTNMTKCLSAYDDADGSPTTTAASVSGNIYSRTIIDNNDYQFWCLYDENNCEIKLEDAPFNMETGNYYISNYTVGKYLSRSTPVNCSRGTIENLGWANVSWKIVKLTDGSCLLQHPSNPSCLAPKSNNENSELKMVNLFEPIPDEYKWVITTGEYGGALLRNKKSNLYLTAESTTEESVTSLYMIGKADLVNNPQLYKLQTWNLIQEEYYHELSEGYSFESLIMKRNDDFVLNISDEYANATWTESDDFIFSVVYSTNDCISLDNTYGRVQATGWGYAEIKAIHKVTNIESEVFTILVPCGGPNNTNGRLHDYEYITHENCYECSKCFNLIDTPEKQDPNILTLEDYRYVLALQMAYIYCVSIYNDYSFSLEERNEATINAEIALIMIDAVRRKDEYDNKYDYRDSDGKCIETGLVLFDSSYDEYYSKMLHETVNAGNIYYYSGVLNSLVDFVAGGVSDIISNMQTLTGLITADMDMFDVIALLADTYLEDSPISDIISLLGIGVDIINSEVSLGDELYQVTVTNGYTEDVTVILQYSADGIIERILINEPLF